MPHSSGTVPTAPGIVNRLAVHDAQPLCFRIGQSKSRVALEMDTSATGPAQPSIHSVTSSPDRHPALDLCNSIP